MTPTPDGLTASVRRRLLDLATRTGDDPNVIWSRYAVERLLYRLSVSEFAGEFALKGAVLFAVWSDQPHRPTMDLDLLAFGPDSEERIALIFQAVCDLPVEPDGLRFDTDSLRIQPIRETAEYQGRRVTLTAWLGKARIPVRVDMGFGDVVTPATEMVDFPTLLDLPAPRVRACPRQTVVAEKLHALVTLGMANSRMKDFYDLYVLSDHFTFEGTVLVGAVQATFQRRKTSLPADTPVALTEELFRDAAKQAQWAAFTRRLGEKGPPVAFIDVWSRLRLFLLPVLESAAERGPALCHWPAGGPWQMGGSA
ncbi:MAG: nucleotidyl transferase AbiEii/AbiGii toxin family protein [Planctomycetes bacterium]|nr:nucleotidyl transferase AbiEii/AbiGii toxin family protein [Planctomycetota bacterium]